MLSALLLRWLAAGLIQLLRAMMPGARYCYAYIARYSRLMLMLQATPASLPYAIRRGYARGVITAIDTDAVGEMSRIDNTDVEHVDIDERRRGCLPLPASGCYATAAAS